MFFFHHLSRYLRTEQRFNFSHVRRLQSLWPPAPRPRSLSTWPPPRRWEIVMSGPIFVNIININIISNNTTIIIILAAAQSVGGQIVIDLVYMITTFLLHVTKFFLSTTSNINCEQLGKINLLCSMTHVKNHYPFLNTILLVTPGAHRVGDSGLL